MVAKVYFDADMRRGIPGLSEIYSGIGMAMFMNKKKNKVKIFWGGSHLLYFSKQHGKIELEDLRKIPEYFKGTFINGSVNAKLERQLGIKLERQAG